MPMSAPGRAKVRIVSGPGSDRIGTDFTLRRDYGRSETSISAVPLPDLALAVTT